MNDKNNKFVGFSCAYTPLPLISAAGFVPYRIFPMGDQPDQAGAVMHENMCPHVKRILDRAMGKDLPVLSGMVFMDSCESMRRLYDAWRSINPYDRRILVDLPLHANETSADYLSKQVKILTDTLSEWSGKPVTHEAIHNSVGQYSQLSKRLARLEQRAAAGMLSRSVLQRMLNRSVTQPLTQTLSELGELENQPPSSKAGGLVPVLLFGNVLPDPKALSLFEESGCRIVHMDTCTGARQHVPYDEFENKDPYIQMARSMLNRPLCARSLVPEEPGVLAKRVLESARLSGARGVVAHVMKFCDPYLARIPLVMKALKKERIPLLILEGDCTLRSFGQYRTRIEAFTEILVR